MAHQTWRVKLSQSPICILSDSQRRETFQPRLFPNSFRTPKVLGRQESKRTIIQTCGLHLGQGNVCQRKLSRRVLNVFLCTYPLNGKNIISPAPGHFPSRIPTTPSSDQLDLFGQTQPISFHPQCVHSSTRICGSTGTGSSCSSVNVLPAITASGIRRI